MGWLLAVSFMLFGAMIVVAALLGPLISEKATAGGTLIAGFGGVLVFLLGFDIWMDKWLPWIRKWHQERDRRAAVKELKRKGIL